MMAKLFSIQQNFYNKRQLNLPFDSMFSVYHRDRIGLNSEHLKLIALVNLKCEIIIIDKQ